MIKEKPKICPLLSISWAQQGSTKPSVKAMTECLKEECAWYYVFRYPHVERVDKGCAVQMLPQVLSVALRK
jgi:hypothetical protein